MKEKKNLGTEISDSEIKLVISDGDRWMADLNREAEALRREYEQLGETIYQYVAWRSSSLPTGSRAPKTEDAVLRTVLHKETELKRCRRELIAAIARLEEQRIRLKRIRAAYSTLPRREYQVLNELYEKRTTWAQLPQVMALSKQKVCRLRSGAFARIRAAVERQEAACFSGENRVAESAWEYGEEGNSACIRSAKPYNGW